jgi:peptide/nickel transport system permease protein
VSPAPVSPARGAGRFLVRRLSGAILLLWIVLTCLFFVLRLAPPDAQALLDDPRIPASQRARVREIYGDDRPLLAQYGRWLGAATRWDWGFSVSRQEPVADAVGRAIPPTLLLCGTALLLGAFSGVTAAIFAVRRPGRLLDGALRFLAVLSQSVPAFWLGLLAVLAFAVRWPLFPASHMRSAASPGAGGAGILDLAWHLALPAAVLSLVVGGEVFRFARNRLLDVLSSDTVLSARARGLSATRVLVGHALPLAAGPLVQLLGLLLPMLVSGALTTELVFAWPGLGRLSFEALSARDYPLVMATAALTASVVVAGNFLADLLHAAIDPRVRLA